jgi:hypothetical protein
VHSSSDEMCSVCNLGERILFSISSCKRTDSNIYGSKPNNITTYMTCHVRSAVDDIKRKWWCDVISRTSMVALFSAGNSKYTGMAN